MSRTFTFLALLFLLFLAACGPAAPAPTQGPLHLPTEPGGDGVLLVGQPPAQTPTLARMTSTPQPTATATPSGLPLLGVDPQHFGVDSGSSPDGEWLWAIEPAGAPAEKGAFRYHKTRFARANGSAYWVVQPELSQLGPGPGGEISYRPVFWQPGDPFVYLAANKGGSDAQTVYFLTGFNLVRLDLLTGKVVTQVRGWQGHDFAFSADGTYLADIPQSQTVLRLTNLVSGQVDEIDLPPVVSQNGNTMFSPDNKLAVVQSCTQSKPDLTGCVRYPLLVVDIQTKRAAELIHDLRAVVDPQAPGKFADPRLSWVDATHLHLDFPAQTKIPGAWQIDAKTGQIHQMTQ